MGDATLSMITRQITLTFLVAINISAVYSQNNYVDSLENLVGSKTPDTVKVWALNELSREHIYSAPEKAAKLANDAMAFSKEIGYKRGEAYSHRVLASLHSGRDYLAYTNNLQAATRLFMELKDSIGLANCYITEAVEYGRQFNSQQAIVYYEKALPIFRKAKIDNRIAVCLSNLGFEYLQIGMLHEARKSFIEAIAVNKSTKNSAINMDSYVNLGLVEYRLGNLDMAEECFSKVFSLNEEMKTNASPGAFVEALIGQSLIHKLRGQNDKQKKLLLAARENARKFGYLNHERDALFYLSEAYLKAGNNSQAFEALKSFKIADDSINRQNLENKASEIASVINSVKLETDFEHARDDLAKQGQVIEQQEKTLITAALIGILLFVMIILLLIINRNRKMMNRTMTAHREAIDKKNSELEKLVKTKDKFFSVVAHDLRSPLNSLYGFSNLIVKHSEHMSKEDIQKMGRKLRESVENTLKMTENLITWARTQMYEEQTHPESIELRSIIEETFDISRDGAQKKGITLNGMVNDGMKVYADRNHFSLILRNLISNAIKYTDSGGEICVDAFQENGRITIVVKDTGLGMDEEVLRQLFTLERTVSQPGTAGERGTGLGLLMCKEFAERNGGTLQVESKKNTGSSFMVSLPSFQH